MFSPFCSRDPPTGLPLKILKPTLPFPQIDFVRGACVAVLDAHGCFERPTLHFGALGARY